MFSKKEVIFQRLFSSKLLLLLNYYYKLLLIIIIYKLLNYFCKEREREEGESFIFIFDEQEIIWNVLKESDFWKIFPFEIIIKLFL